MAGPNWSMVGACATTLAVALVIAGGVGNLTVSPIDSHLTAVDHEIEKINLTMAPLLTLYAQHTSDLQVISGMQKQLDAKLDSNVYDVSNKAVEKEIAENNIIFSKTLEEITHQVHTLEDKIVSRAENSEHWAEVANRLDDLNRRIEATSFRLNGSTQFPNDAKIAK